MSSDEGPGLEGDVTAALLPHKKTKVVCTIGPASAGEETLQLMAAAGMDVARLNFAHGTPVSHRHIIRRVRNAAATTGRRIALLGDLPGPKIRLGKLESEPIELSQGDPFSLYVDELVGDSRGACLNFPGLTCAVTVGDRIFLNDGVVELEVREIKERSVACEVRASGEIRSQSGVNFPGIDLGVGAFTERDRALLAFAAEQQLDAIGVSFVQSARDVQEVRSAAAELGYEPMIIAKVERSQAVDHLEGIVSEADGIMVARGDLGVETPIERIGVTQKRIIHCANVRGKPVITATHMLESMKSSRRPTRAEATDVTNAILDGTDCVMLSGETAVGSYPVECVAVISRIARVTEPFVDTRWVTDELQRSNDSGGLDLRDQVSLSVLLASDSLSPVAIVCPTLSGRTARLVTRFHLTEWLVAVSPNEATCQRLKFSFGVWPQLETERPESWERYAREWMASNGVEEGIILLTHGSGTVAGGGTNQIGIVDLGGPQPDTDLW